MCTRAERPDDFRALGWFFPLVDRDGTVMKQSKDPR
jgi:hypothetical protein